MCIMEVLARGADGNEGETMTEQEFTYAVDGMLTAALWSSTDENGEPLDANYAAYNIAPATITALVADIVAFIGANSDDIAASGMVAEQVGHDFWLTRNHHGAGFWDRGLGEVGERLTAATRPYGEVDLYVGDDGLIYA